LTSALAGIATPSFAQNAPEQSDEIIVTATRRAEGIQDVPLSVSAVTGEKLEQQGARGYEDYLRTIPGVNFNSGPVNNSNFAIRGLSTETSNANLQPTVALYINDLPTIDPIFPLGFTDLPAFDIDRVEVLRGPQGTLFGSGSLGGAIRIITNQPKQGETEALLELRGATTKGGDKSGGVAAMVNVPLGESVAFRVAADLDHVGGVIDNVTRSVENADDIDTFSLRAALGWRPNDRFNAVASYILNNSRPQDNTLANDNSPIFLDPVVLNPFETNSLTPEIQRNRLSIVSLDLSAEFGGFNATSITSYSWRDIFRSRDFGELDSPLSSAFVGVPLPSEEITTNDGRIFSQEVRLASTGDGRFSWLGGVFFVRRTNDALIVEGDPGYIGSGFERPGTGNIVEADFETASREAAVFGELAYRFTDELRLALSGRGFWNRTEQNDITTWAFGPGIEGVRNFKSSGFTPRVVLDYQPTDDVLFYASYSEGYRVGGPNLPLPGLPASFDSDTVDAYEVGAKTTLLDGGLVLNAAFFRNDWKDIQVNEVIGGLAALNNGPNARSQGLELEAVARPNDSIEVSWGLAYTNAELREDAPNVNLNRGGLTAGDRLPGVPRFTSSESIRYSFDLGGSAQGFLLALHSYQGESFNGFNRADPLVKAAGPWHRVGLRAGVEIRNFELSAHVDNLLNSDAIQNVAFNGGFQRDGLARLRPRTFGLTLRARY
jgi:outer membrane receptor protein involved in Fe transport